MPEPFTIENGMQTPTLKLRRHIIVKTYRELIEGLWHGPRASCLRGNRRCPSPGSGGFSSWL